MVAILLALAIGVAVGVLGGGGSLLTVPVFTYVLDYDPTQAVAMSLPVVGLAAAAGAVRAWIEGLVRPRAVLTTGLSAMAGAAAGSYLARFITGRTQLLLLAVTMIGAAVAMVQETPPERVGHVPHPAALAASGVIAGLLTGLVGVSGGFLIVPALVMLGGLPMREAIGASLSVMALSTAAGFAGYVGRVVIPWPTVLLFAGVTAAGTLAGGSMRAHVPAARLKWTFALALVLLASVLLVRG